MPSDINTDIPPPSEIEPNLWLCDFYNLYDPDFLPESRINAVVSLLDDYAPLFTRPEFTQYIAPERHLFVRCSDTKTEDLLGKLAGICEFIERMLPGNELKGREQEGEEMRKGVVLVHCEEGVSRSPSVVVAYLVRRDGLGVAEVLERVKRKRGIVAPSENFLGQLREWEAKCRSKMGISG